MVRIGSFPMRYMSLKYGAGKISFLYINISFYQNKNQ